MDCSPLDSVEKFYNVELTLIKCHGFNVAGLSDRRIKRKVEDMKSNLPADERSSTPTINNSAPSIQFVFGKYSTRKPFTKAEKIRRLVAQNRSYENKIIKLEKEIIMKKHKHEKQQLRLMNEIEESSEKVRVRENELKDCRAQIRQSHLVIASKDEFIDTIHDENKRYKQHTATASRSIIERLEAQIKELSNETETLKRKLRQPWKIFVRSKLHKRIENNNTLQKVFENMAEKLQGEIDCAEKFKF